MTTAPAPRFPLPLRNALAELAIAALDDPAARAGLDWLAAGGDARAPADVRPRLAAVHLIDDDGALLAVHGSHRDAARAHAGRALRAAGAHAARAPTGNGVPRAIAKAVALWNERLFFEVHEVLEAEWKTAGGLVRQALQGVIQIGVAFHHHAHGNARGARTLMHEGRERLAASATALPTLAVARLLDDTAPWDAALARGDAPRDGTPPTLRLTDD